MARYPLWTLFCIISLSAACRTSPASVPVVDFVKEFDRAERRPVDGYRLTSESVAAVVRPSIEGPAPGRLIWALPIPHHGTFRSFVASSGGAPVRFRVGVSDDRIYEQLAEVTVAAGSRGWTALEADLSPYAGWKWSLFYRPDRVVWRLILSADAVAGVAERIVWGSPHITTDPSSAREYAERRQASRGEAQKGLSTGAS